MECNTLGESWAPIKGYEEHYEVSNLGKIRSIDRFVAMKWSKDSKKFCKGTIKNATKHYKNNYLSVMLKTAQQEKRVLVHRVVAETFISNPNLYPQVNHINGNKNDNRVENLEWTTELENNRHALRTGLKIPKGKSVIAIKDCAIIEFNSIDECSREMGIDRRRILFSSKQNTEYIGYKFAI